MDRTEFLRCRGCLNEGLQMHSIFDYSIDDLALADILSQTTSTQIDPCQGISAFLCETCTEIVLNFYNFKLDFTKNQEFFKNEVQKLENETKYVLKKGESTDEEEEVSLDSESLFGNKIENSNREVTGQDKSIEIDKVGGNNETKADLCFLSINTTANDVSENTQSMLDAKFNSDQDIPEVGEFTVENELVQLFESTIFNCKTCGKEYLTENKFLSHMRLEHQKLKIDVNEFSKKKLVKIPLGKVKVEECLELEGDNKVEEYKLCKICNTQVLEGEYKNHRAYHKMYICNICGASYVKKSELVYHEESKHSCDRNYICKYCNKTFKIKQVLSKHLRLHTHPGQEVCHICGQIFNELSVMKTHIKLKHFPSKDYQCNECGLKFSLKSTLYKHIRRHDTSRNRSFSCSICKMSYYDRYTLKRHISVKHSNQDTKVKCDYCSKTFTMKGNLYKHLRTIHKNEKEHVP